MSIVTFPSTLDVEKFSWEYKPMDVTFSSNFGTQSIGGGMPKWAASISAPDIYEYQASQWQTLLMQLRGRQNQLALWNLARPVPLGTYRGSPTLSSSVAMGDTTMTFVDATQASKTLKVGDYVGIGSGLTQQVVMLVADATANGSGVITVTFEPPLRNAFATSTAITLDKPKALFRQTASSNKWDYSGVFASGFALDLQEDWRV
jgi:hypothetical protein